jgi:hypothetical protein
MASSLMPSSAPTNGRTLLPDIADRAWRSRVRQGPAEVRNGVAVAAIAMALFALRRRQAQPPCFDAVRSAVYIRASDGNGSAYMGLTYAPRQSGDPTGAAMSTPRIAWVAPHEVVRAKTASAAGWRRLRDTPTEGRR